MVLKGRLCQVESKQGGAKYLTAKTNHDFNWIYLQQDNVNSKLIISREH